MMNQSLAVLAAMSLLVACSSATTATAPTDGRPSCADRQCGVDPGTKQDCGSCQTPGALACNDGRCEATCDPKKCSAMSYEQNTCGKRTQCQESVPGAHTVVTFSCSDDGARCEQEAEGVSCGVVDTECASCDLTGTGDGRCFDQECKSLGDVASACKNRRP